MTVPLAPSVARGDPDALIIFTNKTLGVVIKGDNELALWGEHAPPQAASLSTLTTQANAQLAAGDATTYINTITKKKGAK